MPQRKGGLVSEVLEGSLADYLGIEPGDRIVSVNGRRLRDELDFRFFSADGDLSLTIRKKDGAEETFEIDKDPAEPLGVAFHGPLFDKVKTCQNNCAFCFVRQIPKEMRRTLHVRDDDYRMSFLYGNFLSLTNLTGDEWERLSEQRISPLRISVHTTDAALRQELMGNPKAGRIMDDLCRLRELGIRMHIQIVLLKEINDGDRLLKTLADLDSMGDSIVLVGVVPAVYTRYRVKAPSARTDAAWAGETLDLIEHYASGVRGRRKDSWVYGADEFYLTAGREFPPYEYYGEFHQYENGIGVVPEWRRRLSSAVEMLNDGGGSGTPEDVGREPKGVGRTLIVTGVMAAGEMRDAVEALGLEDRVFVCVVPNVFFGDAVTVAGLLTGQDILAGVLRFTRDTRNRYDAVLVPRVAVHEGRFLDDLSVARLSSAIGIPVEVVEPSPESLVRAVFKQCHQGSPMAREIGETKNEDVP